ncbi:RES family NAD+ phosphorylase [Paraburkholderia panacisoli]|uniref:RES family NAD+ phosphorylase n=1 Tax=Paraburkholderia panacisoli TaxID=2603818 RepID=A0A5B0GEF8_9BURK|nr:RES family NAD+ phosphorylase [Paraburkholderia panacisoli]
MVLWRISNCADLKGLGGLRAPGRWHFAGQPVVHLAEHPAGALLETLVHEEISSTGDLPDTYRLLKWVATPRSRRSQTSCCKAIVHRRPASSPARVTRRESISPACRHPPRARA